MSKEKDKQEKTGKKDPVLSLKEKRTAKQPNGVRKMTKESLRQSHK